MVGSRHLSKTQLIFGIHAVHGVLKSDAQNIQEICVQRGREDQRIKKLWDLAKREGIPCKLVNRRGLDQLVDGNHQGVVAYCNSSERYNEDFLVHLLEKLPRPPFLLVLDGVTDPHNIGACLRSAEAAGVDAVIAPRDRSAGLNATARKVACGAADVMPFVTVTNLARTLKLLQSEGVWVVGAAGEAEASLYDVDLRGALAIVLGAEGEGLRRLTRDCCDILASIPLMGTVGSLNVSVAAGVCLFEALRQRKEH